MRRGTRAFLAVLSGTGLILAAVAPAGALTGNQASSPGAPLFSVAEGPADPPNCDVDGESTPEFSGLIPVNVGPYSGKYMHLDGQLTLGPQTNNVDPDNDPIYGFAALFGAATDVSGTFTIAQADGSGVVVNGTLDGLAAPLGGPGSNVGSCYGIGAGDHFGWSNVSSGTLQAMDLHVNYTFEDGTGPRTGRLFLRQRQAIGVLPEPEGTQIGYTGGTVNFYTPTQPVVTADTTPPQVSITTPAHGAEYLLGEAVASNYSCSDDADPAPSCVGPVASGSQIDTSTAGPKSFTVTATDSSGNTHSETHSYTVKPTYGLTGFSAPVDHGALNVSKAGQTIPLKFRVTDASGHGITTLTTVPVKATSLSCALGTTTDQLEEYATGASGLKHLGDGNYQYNWQTPKSYAGSCKTLTVTVAPGAALSAEFAFKK